MEQSLTIHVTCRSQFAVHYFEFQFKVTLIFTFCRPRIIIYQYKKTNKMHRLL
jgi:hypothetical protein